MTWVLRSAMMTGPPPKEDGAYKVNGRGKVSISRRVTGGECSWDKDRCDQKLIKNTSSARPSFLEYENDLRRISLFIVVAVTLKVREKDDRQCNNKNLSLKCSSYSPMSTVEISSLSLCTSLEAGS